MFGTSTMKRSALALAATAIALVLPSQALSAAAVDTPATPGGSPSGVSTTAPYSAAAATSVYGIDISYPQCNSLGSITTIPSFTIVGVNNGLANAANPCLKAELEWAAQSTGSTTQPKVALYINTGNPGLAGKWWPTSNTTKSGLKISNPLGTCAGKAGAACAYVYGYSMALDDAQTFLPAAGGAAASTYFWWLDVETINSWSEKDIAGNAASIAGMATYLKSIKAKVGIYSTAYQWKLIAGTTKATSTLAKLPSWLAGASSSANAAARCAYPPLTAGGRVSVVQWKEKKESIELDYNYSCKTFTTTPKPKVTGTAKVGKKLTSAAGTWAPSYSKLTYQWKVNGKAIARATTRFHTITKAEAGKRITVTTTATKTGYTPVVLTSASTAKVAK